MRKDNAKLTPLAVSKGKAVSMTALIRQREIVRTAFCAGAMFALAAGIASGRVYANEAKANATASAITNFGFVKEPPKELRGRFPMCDEFLKVEWIDKEKRVGYAHYEAQLMDRKGNIGEERKSIWALVTIDDIAPSYTRDIYQFRRQGKMDVLSNMVRSGTISVRGSALYISSAGRLEIFFENYDKRPVLAGFRKEICILYPDEKRAWAIEGREVKYAYSQEQRRELVMKLNAFNLQAYSQEYLLAHGMKESPVIYPDEFVDSLWVIRANRDSKDDFVKLTPLFEAVFYSVGDRYYRMSLKEQAGPEYRVWAFPPFGGSCRLPHGSVYFITTDGKSYFFNNGCNLTQLTSPKEQEDASNNRR